MVFMTIGQTKGHSDQNLVILDGNPNQFTLESERTLVSNLQNAIKHFPSG